jgi:hypothetical protein
VSGALTPEVLHLEADAAVGRRARRPSERACEWAALESRLSRSLACLQDGHFLILETREDDGYYVQFAAEGSQGMRVEAVSNRFLDSWRRLDRTALDRLRRLGWRPPTEIGDGPVNWWRSFDAPVPAADIATLAVATLTKAFDVGRAACLTYQAFSRDGAKILLPELGVEHHQDADQPPALAERVDAIMRGYLGADEVRYDHDGDIPIRTGDAMVFVRPAPDAGFVVVFSPFLHGIAESYGLLAAVNTINGEIRTARAVMTGAGVSIFAEIDDGADLEAGLIRACEGISALANTYATKLQSQFGGATFFEDPAAQAPATGTGLYL